MQQCVKVCPRASQLTQAFMSVIYQGYEERVFEAERGSDGEYGVEAAQQSSEQDEFANVRLHGQTGQMETQRRQILRAVQGVLTHSGVTTPRNQNLTSFVIYSST